MPTPVVVAYGRTPCCRARKGGLADMHPIDYAAQALKGVIAKVPYIQMCIRDSPGVAPAFLYCQESRPLF